MFALLQQANHTEERSARQVFKGPQVVSGGALCSTSVFLTVVVRRGRFVQLDADQGVFVRMCFCRNALFACLACKLSACSVSLWTITVINKVTEKQIQFFLSSSFDGTRC